MLFPGAQFRIFCHLKPLDMRCGIDRIAHLCKSELDMNPYGGAVFLFFSRDRVRAKIYFFDAGGSCLFLKRLERGRFKVPQLASAGTHTTIPSSELALLLEGVDVQKIKRPRPWVPKNRSKDKPSQGLANPPRDSPS
jgi:transposase